LKIEVREAVQSDKEPLMQFIKDIWGGHDYLPFVWDDWLKERGSKMFVVLADGKQVGMNHVRFLEDGSAWFEGARVHPEFRGRGLATELAERSMSLAARRGAKIFRLTSGSWNRQAHRQIARIGFEEASRISVYKPSKGMKFGGASAVKRAGAGSLDRVTSAIRGSREFRIGSGVMWDTFAARGLSPKVIEENLRAGHIFTSGDGVAVARQGGERDESWNQVCFVTGDDEEAVRLVEYVFGSKGMKDPERCFAYLPQGSRLIGALRRSGFERDYSLVLFEKRPANG